MRDYKNLQRVFCSIEHPNAPMYEQEVNAIFSIIDSVINRASPNINRGTFILDGQKNGESAECILRFNVTSDDYDSEMLRLYNKTTDDLAEQSIDELLALPGKSRYTDGNLPGRIAMREKIKSPEDVRSGLWCDSELQALVVNTTFGRFILSCYLCSSEGQDDKAIEAVLYAVAQTLLLMGKEDQELQDFRCQLSAAASSQMCVCDIIGFVAGLLESFEQPALHAWHEWHTPLNSSGGLELFFE